MSFNGVKVKNQRDSPFSLGLGVPKAGLGSFTSILEPAAEISNKMLSTEEM